MPLYDFRCTACGERFEAVAPVSATVPCPSCTSPSVERVYGVFASVTGPAMRGYTARRSDASRAAREEQRLERRAERRAAREGQS